MLATYVSMVLLCGSVQVCKTKVRTPFLNVQMQTFTLYVHKAVLWNGKQDDLLNMGATHTYESIKSWEPDIEI